MNTGAGRKAKIWTMATASLAVVLSFLSVSCRNGGKQLGAAIENRDSTSVMTTVGVDMLISENGMLHYHVTAPEWMIFDRMDPPFYSLEKGVYLEIFDSLQQVSSTLRADTAYYFNDTELWVLKSNVHAENVAGETFDTQSLNINNRSNRIFSDSAIVIRQPDKMLKGVGFESNGNMTEYFIRHSEGAFPVNDIDGNPSAQDTLSIANP